MASAGPARRLRVGRSSVEQRLRVCSHLLFSSAFLSLLSASSVWAQAPDPDLNNDGVVNILDVSMVSSCFGQVVPTTPVLAILEPPDGSLLTSTPIPVSGTVVGGVASIEVNGSPATVNGGAFVADGVPLQEGVNIITATATTVPNPCLPGDTDGDGDVDFGDLNFVTSRFGQSGFPVGGPPPHFLVGTASIQVVLETGTADTEPPEVTVSAPAQVVAGSTLALSATATDASGVASVSFLVNGVLVTTDTEAPYQTELPLPPGTLPGAILQVEARAVDVLGHEATVSVEVRVIAPAMPGGGVIAGRVYDDSSGLPVSDATVRLLSLNGEPPGSTVSPVASDERGRFRLAADPGTAQILISREGFTESERLVDVVEGRRTDPFDARLTPLDVGRGVSSVLGGRVSASSGEMELVIPAGALAADGTIHVTSVDLQGLMGRLPLGWSPVVVVDISPGNLSFNIAASLSLPVPSGLPTGVELQVARWDESGAWVALGGATRTADGKRFELSLIRFGQYAFLLADPPPDSPPPPTVGQAIPGLLPNPPPDNLAAEITPSPRILFAEADAKSEVGVLVKPPSRIPSGTPFQTDLDESFSFFDGGNLYPDPAGQHFTLYAFPPAGLPNLQSDFTVTPSRVFESQELELGIIDLAVRLPIDPGAPRGIVVGPDGGIAEVATGERLVVPAGATSESLPVVLSELALADFPVSIPLGLSFLGAVTLDFHGGALNLPAELSVPVPTVLTPGAQVLVVQLVEVDSVSYLALVSLGLVQGNDLLAATDPRGDGSLVLPGVQGEGRYAFLEAETPLGFVAGTVRGDNGLPQSGSLVSVDTLDIVSLTDAAGRYVLASPIGDVQVTATNPETGDVATASATIGSPDQVVNLDQGVSATPVFVLSISPANGTQNVDLSAAITVRFSEPVDPASLAPDALMVSDGTTLVAGRTSFVGGNAALTFRPSTLLVSQTTYQVTVSGAIQDLSGNPMGAPFVSQFATVDQTPPPPPPPGTITATIPDGTGRTIVSGTQGTAEPGGIVIVKNLTTGTLTTVTADTDGSFSAQVAASTADKLQLILRDAFGNETVVAIGSFRNPDGSVVVGSEGGRVEGSGGVFVEIPPGALPEGTVVKIDPALATDFPLPAPADFPFAGGVRLSLGGVVPRQPLDIGVPAPVGASAADQVLVARPVQLRSGPAWTVVDRAHLETGRYVTASFPFVGVVEPGSYSFIRYDGHRIRPGPNGVLDSLPALADDVVEQVSGIQVIRAGENTVLDTPVRPDDVEERDCLSYVHVRYQFSIDVVLLPNGIPFVFTNFDSDTATMPLVCDKQFSIQVVAPNINQVIKQINVVASPTKDDIQFFPEVLSDDDRPPIIVETNTFSGQIVGQIKIRFSEPMDESSVQESFQITDSLGSELKGTLTLLENDTLAVFRPELPFRLGERYLVLLSGAKDLAGNELVAPPIVFTPLDPAASENNLSMLGKLPQICQSEENKNDPRCLIFSALRKCSAQGCTTSTRDADFLGTVLFLANGLSTLDQEYENPSDPRRLLAVDTSDPSEPRLIGWNATATNPLAVAAVEDASFASFVGNLLLVAGGGRVRGGELNGKLEIYDASACKSGPGGITNCLDDSLAPLRGVKFLSTASGIPPRPGVPPEWGIPLQIATLHQKNPAADDILRAFVVVAAVGIEGIDVTKSFNVPLDPGSNVAPDALVRGDFLDVAVLKNRVLAVEHDPASASFSLALFTAELGRFKQVKLPASAARVAGLENLLVDIDDDGLVGAAEDNDDDELSAVGEIFDLGLVTSGSLTEGCQLTSPCGELLVVDLSPHTNVAHLEDLGIVSRIPLPGPAFSLQVDAEALTAYVEVRGHGLAVVDLSHIKDAIAKRPSLALIDVNEDGRDDRLLAMVPKSDIFMGEIQVDTERGLAFVNGSTTGLDIVRVSVHCNELALDFRETDPPAERRDEAFQKEKQILQELLGAAALALMNAPNPVPKPALLEQGSGACFWKEEFDDHPAATCRAFDPALSDHDIEVMVPNDRVEDAQGILDDFLKSETDNPESKIHALGDLSLFAVPREAFESGEFPVAPPQNKSGDSAGDLGLGRQILVLFWVLDGEYVAGFEGLPLGEILERLKDKGDSPDPVIPGEPSIPRLEGYEWSFLQEFNFQKTGPMLRIAGGCEAPGVSFGVSPAGFSDVDAVDPGRNFEEREALFQGCQEQLHTVGKAAIRSVFGRVVADAEGNALVLDIDRDRFATTACRGVANPHAPPSDPAGYIPKRCGSFEEYALSVAVRSVEKELGIFEAQDLPKIFGFFCAKLGTNCPDKNDRPIGKPLITTDEDANRFIADALQFIQKIRSETEEVYFETVPADTKKIGALPFFQEIKDLCSRHGVDLTQESARRDMRECTRQIVLRKLEGDPSIALVPETPVEIVLDKERRRLLGNRLGVRGHVLIHHRVRALNKGQMPGSVGLRMYEGDGLTTQDYAVKREKLVENLREGEKRVIETEPDPEAPGKKRPVFPTLYVLDALGKNSPRAIAFYLDPEGKTPEADRTDNFAGFFYYVLDPDQPEGPDLPDPPAFPVEDDELEPEPGCPAPPLIHFEMTGSEIGDEPGVGAKVVTITFGQKVRLTYRVRSNDEKPLARVEVFTPGKEEPILAADNLAPGKEVTQEEIFDASSAGTFTRHATAFVKDDFDNVRDTAFDSVTIHVIPLPCVIVSPLSPDPNPINDEGLPMSTVMQGGRLFRYYQVLDGSTGDPVPGVTVSGKLRNLATGAEHLLEPIPTDSDGRLVHAKLDDKDDPLGLMLSVDAFGEPKDSLVVDLDTVSGFDNVCAEHFLVDVQERRYSRSLKSGTEIGAQGALATFSIMGKKGFGIDITLPGAIKLGFPEDENFLFGRTIDASAGVGRTAEGAKAKFQFIGEVNLLSAGAKAGVSVLQQAQDVHEFPPPVDKQDQIDFGLLLADTVRLSATSSVSTPVLSLALNELNERATGLSQRRTKIAASMGVEVAASGELGAATLELEKTPLGDLTVGLGNVEAGINLAVLAGAEFLLKEKEADGFLEARAAFEGSATVGAALESKLPLIEDEDEKVGLKLSVDFLKDLFAASADVAGNVRFAVFVDTDTLEVKRVVGTIGHKKEFGFTALGNEFVDSGDGNLRTVSYIITDLTQFKKLLEKAPTLAALTIFGLTPGGELPILLSPDPKVLMGDLLELLRVNGDYEKTFIEGKGVEIPFGAEVFFAATGLKGSAKLRLDSSVGYAVERGALRRGRQYKLERYPENDPLVPPGLGDELVDDIKAVLESVKQLLTPVVTLVKQLILKGIGVPPTLTDLFFSPSGVELLVDGAAEPDPDQPFEIELIGFKYRPTDGPPPALGLDPADVAGPADEPHYGVGGFFQFAPDGRELAAPAQLTVHYDDSEVEAFDESTLAIYVWNQDRVDWDFVGGTVDPVENTVTDAVTRLGLYTVAPPMPAGEITFSIQSSPAGNAQSPATRVTFVSNPVFLNTGDPVPDGTRFTVRTLVAGTNAITPLGTNLSDDQDPVTQGVQVISQSGVIQFTAELPGRVGSTLLIVNSVEGTALANRLVSYRQ